MRPRLLDLFCGAGGAAKGYWLAGFDVIGVDEIWQKNYPYTFQWGDALDIGQTILAPPVLEGIAAVHASPPCQHHSALTKGGNTRHAYPEMIDATRDLLDASGLPYIIENVMSAPLRDPVMLCGEMFGLSVIRHRLFESNVELTAPAHPRHRGRVAGFRHGTWHEGPYFAVHGRGGGKGTVRQWQQAMGIDWTGERHELAEAIPPAYTEYLGRQLIAHVW